MHTQRSSAASITTIAIGRTRIILGRVVAIYVEVGFADPAGLYIKAGEMLAIGRMNGLGNYIRTLRLRRPHIINGHRIETLARLYECIRLCHLSRQLFIG